MLFMINTIFEKSSGKCRIIDERSGTFDLVKDSQTLERLFSMIDQLKDVCELMNINQPDSKTYKIISKGEVVREGNFLRITKKLKLDWA